MDGSQRGTTEPIHSDRNLGLNLFGLPTRGQGVRIQTEEEDEAKISNIYIYAVKLRECLPGNVEGIQATRCTVGTTVCPIGRRDVGVFVSNAVSQVSGMMQHPVGAILD